MRLSPLMNSQKKELGRALSRLAAEPGFEGVIHSAASNAGLDAISNVLKGARLERPEESRESGSCQAGSLMMPARAGGPFPSAQKPQGFATGTNYPTGNHSPEIRFIGLR